jgi:hypothetical protein
MLLSYLFGSYNTCRGLFTLPTGDDVEGLMRLDFRKARIVLEVSSSHALSSEKSHIIYGLVNQTKPVTLVGHVPHRSVYLSSLPNYEINCTQLLDGFPRFDPSKHEITKTRFGLSGGRSIFRTCVSSVHPDKRREVLKAILGESFTPDDHGERFDRVFFSSGAAELLSCEIGKYGRLSVRKSGVTTLPGIDVECIIEHPPETNLSDVEGAIECVTRFFWLITGVRQYAANIRINVQFPSGIGLVPFFDGTKTRTHEHKMDAKWIEAHFPLQEESLSTEGTRERCGQTSHDAHLITVDESRQNVEQCLRNWAKLSKRQRRACDLILSVFNSQKYPLFRIAQASSAFDWFCVDCKRLPIKVIVKRRLDLIQKYLPDELKDIECVTKGSIKLRNDIVHRRESSRSISTFFLIDTLEFIFLSSVLVECGWDMKSWVEGIERKPISHPFNRYLLHWSEMYKLWQEEASPGA